MEEEECKHRTAEIIFRILASAFSRCFLLANKSILCFCSNNLQANIQESLHWRSFLPMRMQKRCHHRGGPFPSRTMQKKLQMYKKTPPTFTSDDPAAWWWNQRMTYPLMSNMAFSYSCVRASSTPSERVFSTAGDTICAERSWILPEKADMLIFLNKNCF